jgi:hypothetical protein
MPRTQAHPYNPRGSATYATFSGKFPGIETPDTTQEVVDRERIAFLTVARDCPVLSQRFAVSIAEFEAAGLLPRKSEAA